MSLFASLRNLTIGSSEVPTTPSLTPQSEQRSVPISLGYESDFLSSDDLMPTTRRLSKKTPVRRTYSRDSAISMASKRTNSDAGSTRSANRTSSLRKGPSKRYPGEVKIKVHTGSKT
ncbi:hypothetical protein HDU91_003138, partial [Kappamyces sp. JEL0680]